MKVPLPSTIPLIVFVTSVFFDDLSDTLERVVGYIESIFIVGDLNVRLDRGDDSSARCLTELFDAFGFVIRNVGSTHVLGGLLDVVATRCDLPSPCVTTYEAGLSDHRLIQWTVPVLRPDRPVVSVGRGISLMSTCYMRLFVSDGFVDWSAGRTVPLMISLHCIITNLS